MAMAAATGMPLTNQGNCTALSTDHSQAMAGAGAARVTKWCDGCPHRNRGQCFCDPHWHGALPCSIHLNKERLEGIKKTRAKNAAEHGVCEDLQAPSAAKIEAYKKLLKKKGRRSTALRQRAAQTRTRRTQRAPPLRTQHWRSSCKGW